jgi:predicted alpha/beta-hydrolase family hydrolase
MSAQTFSIDVDGNVQVSALLNMPANAHTLYVVAHGAGAGMSHPFMANIASELATLGVGTLRYQFPYMEKGSKRPDPPALCHATVRAAVAEAARHARAMKVEAGGGVPTHASGGVKIIAGGKSFGGRMTSQAQAATPLPNVSGLAFLGFPLHPPKKPSIAGRPGKEPSLGKAPSTERADHLAKVEIPMLFLQGTRDDLADLTLLEPITTKLGARTTLKKIDGADHSFHVLARSGRKDADVLKELAQKLAAWADTL